MAWYCFIFAVCYPRNYLKKLVSCSAGFAQGIRRIFTGLGLIMGPLWAGSMLHNSYWMFGVMLGINILGMVGELE